MPFGVGPSEESGSAVMIPYREFKLEEEEGHLRITEIYLGPTPNVESAQASLILELGLGSRFSCTRPFALTLERQISAQPLHGNCST